MRKKFLSLLLVPLLTSCVLFYKGEHEIKEGTFFANLENLNLKINFTNIKMVINFTEDNSKNNVLLNDKTGKYFSLDLYGQYNNEYVQFDVKKANQIPKLHDDYFYVLSITLDGQSFSDSRGQSTFKPFINSTDENNVEFYYSFSIDFIAKQAINFYESI